MTNLPNLPPVTNDDVAKSTFAYWHRIDMANPGKVAPAIRAALDADRARLIANGHATEPTTLVVLPTVDEIAEVLANDDAAQDLSPDYAWSGMGESTRECFRHNARAVLDLLESRVPHWVRIEPGTVVKAGTRYRIDGDVWAQEKSRDADWTPTGGNVFIDPRTVPAEPEDPALAVVRDWFNSPFVDDDGQEARDLLARIDAARADA